MAAAISRARQGLGSRQPTPPSTTPRAGEVKLAAAGWKPASRAATADGRAAAGLAAAGETVAASAAAGTSAVTGISAAAQVAAAGPASRRTERAERCMASPYC